LFRNAILSPLEWCNVVVTRIAGTESLKGSTMKNTGVFLPDDLFRQVERLLEPTVKQGESGIAYTIPGDREAAWNVIDDFAREQWPASSE
jgi:hypothetical protein